MKNFDLTEVAKVLNPDKNRILYKESGHLFTKVGFDVFQMNNSPVESYWILEKDDDVTEYLTAQYEDEADEPNIEVTSSWEAIADKKGENITLAYKSVPIRRFASAEFNFNQETIAVFINALVTKLASDEKFVSKLVNVLPEEKRNSLIKLFPELA